MVIDAVAFEAIIASVDKQYINELKENYVGYNNLTIKTMIFQLRTWFIITNSEKVAIKAHFHAPWSNTSNSHITTFAHQLDCCQINCSYHGFTIADDNTVVNFIQEMYVCGLFKARFLDNWEENTTKTWKVTLPLFTTQFNKEWRTLERQHQANTFESSNVFYKHDAAGSFGWFTATTSDSEYTAAMEYAAALEYRSTQQEGCILDLKASLYGQTTITLLTDLSASAAESTAATSTASTKMGAIRDVIQIMAASVTTLSTKTLSDGGGGGHRKGCNGGGGGDGTTQTPDIHKCANFKKWVKHKDANCFELEANTEKRFTSWFSRLTKK